MFAVSDATECRGCTDGLFKVRALHSVSNPSGGVSLSFIVVFDVLEEDGDEGDGGACPLGIVAHGDHLGQHVPQGKHAGSGVNGIQAELDQDELCIEELSMLADNHLPGGVAHNLHEDNVEPSLFAEKLPKLSRTGDVMVNGNLPNAVGAESGLNSTDPGAEGLYRVDDRVILAVGADREGLGS